MKTPAATEITTSASSLRIFSYPKKLESACAEVLARLLAGEVMTAGDTQSKASTMRAAAHIHYLTKRYGWHIVSDERAIGCADGRMEIVAAYHLPADCIHAARSASAGAWCTKVRKARAALRAKAAEARRRAAEIEQTRKRQTPPDQGDFFEV